MTQTQENAALRIVLLDDEDSESLDAGVRFEILEKLLSAGYSVTCSTASPAGASGVAPVDESPLLVLGCFPNGAPEAVPDEGDVRVTFQDISAKDADAVLALVETERSDSELRKPGDWKPWFPVIDFQRCTNCMQCLSFCLFDVYGVDADQNIEVRNAEKCKTNCPACSRVCPEVAILFPKYTAGPINGAEVEQQDLEREKMKIDVSALLGGDIYSMLRDRHKKAESRFSKERDEGKALKERIRCLKKLQGEVDIPPEVLMALPSADEIQQKAKDAAAAASAALKAREARGEST